MDAGEVTRLTVRIVPRASRDVVVGMRSGALLVRVTAPPVDGAANEALIRVLSRRLGVARTAVSIATGRTSRVKVVVVRGLAEAETLRRLSAVPGASAEEQGAGQA